MFAQGEYACTSSRVLWKSVPLASVNIAVSHPRYGTAVLLAALGSAEEMGFQKLPPYLLFLSLIGRWLSLSLIELLLSPVSLSDSFCALCQALGLSLFCYRLFSSSGNGVRGSLGRGDTTLKPSLKRPHCWLLRGKGEGERSGTGSLPLSSFFPSPRWLLGPASISQPCSVSSFAWPSSFI